MSCLKVEFYFKRHFMPYFLQIYLPCCVFILISWLPFWLEREAALVKTLISKETYLFEFSIGSLFFFRCYSTFIYVGFYTKHQQFITCGFIFKSYRRMDLRMFRFHFYFTYMSSTVAISKRAD